jgi:hypothetical protein
METKLSQDQIMQANLFEASLLQDLNASAQRVSENYNFDFLQGAPQKDSVVPAYNWEASS